MRLLIFGIGNPGRQDDGLGVFFAEETEKWVKENNIRGVDCDSNYQLMAEDAHTISEYDNVIFADASKADIEDYRFSRISGSETITFSTHSMSPGSVISMCRELYGKEPAVYTLEIKGYEWEVSEPLSEKARNNLNKALVYLKETITNNRL